MVPDLRTAVLEGDEGGRGVWICIWCIRKSEVQEIERERNVLMNIS